MMRDDVADPADHAPVADPQHRSRSEIVPGHHARADRNLLSEHGAVTDLDPALAEDSAHGEGDQGPRPERGEPATRPRIGRDCPGLLDPPPGSIDESGGHSAPPARPGPQ